MNDKISSFIESHKKNIIIFSSLFITSTLIIFFIFTKLNSNKGMPALKNIGKDLSKINLSLEKGLNDMTINTTLASEILSDGSASLKELSFKLSNIETPSEKSIIAKKELANALSTTIALYDFSLYIINNPNEINSSKDLNDFLVYKDDCIKSYNTLRKDGISIDFSDKTLSFFENTYNYTNTVIKINRDRDFKSSNKRKFIIALESFDPTLEKLSEDLMPAIDKIRIDKRDIQVIVDDLYKKEKDFNDIQSSILNISIPDGCMEFYNALQEYLKIYDAYLKSMKDAVIFEKTSDKSEKSNKELEKLYDNASSKREDVISYYSKYKDLFKNS
ncbi:hypothetical protein JCM1393_14810 [Clostridium carnis]